MFTSVKETIDKILIADFFLVLFALAWLGAGVVTVCAEDFVLQMHAQSLQPSSTAGHHVLHLLGMRRRTQTAAAAHCWTPGTPCGPHCGSQPSDC
jgi:hypothetical protein